MSKILEIKEVDNISLVRDDWERYEGYQVITEDKTYNVLITNDQSCCENFGHLQSESDFSEFIGAELYRVVIVDEKLATTEFFDNWVSEDDAIFVNFETSKGTFQLTVYNSHNGYYGHSVKITTSEGEVETSL